MKPVPARLLWLSLVVLLSSVAGAALGAVQADRAQVVRGLVVDPTGAVVADAEVTLEPAASPVAPAPLRTRSAADGTFAFTGVPAGRHILRVHVIGFAPAIESVVVDASLEPRTIALAVAGLAQSVTVEGAATSVSRTDTPLRDQPVSVSTVSSDYLETFAVNDLVVALQAVPNVNPFTQYGVYEYYSFRGFNDSVQTVDGVRNEGNRVRTQLANVERVEVLKGPASVLYGSDAIGATVNIVLKKPSAEPVYDGSVSFGSWETARGAVGAGGRLAGPRVLYRFDAAADRSDGWRHDKSVKFNVTPSVAWQISNRDRLDVRYSGNRNDLSGDGGIPLLPQDDGAFAIPDVPHDRRYNTPADFALSVDHNVRAGYTRTLTDGLVLRAAFSGRKYDDEYWVAEWLEVIPPSEVYREFLYFKHERRPYFGQAEVAGHVRFGVDHDILAGTELQQYRTRTTRSNDASQATTPIDLFDPIETHVTWTTFPPSRYDHTRIRSNAFYGQDSVTLTQSLKAVVGVRFDELQRRTNNNPVVDGVETSVEPVTRRSNAFTYRVGAVYQPIDRVDLYAQYATAFRPNFNLQADGATIEPETGRQFEIGQRLRLDRSNVDVTTALFQVEKRNIALARPGGFFDIAGKVRSRGVEAELAWRPALQARLSVGYGYTDAEYVDYVVSNSSGTVVTDYSGNIRPRVPRHSLNVTGSVGFANGLGLAVSARTRSQQYLNDANSVSLDGYGLLDVNASYTRGRVQYALVLSNLTSTEYWPSSLGNTQLYPGEPLRVLATIRVRTR